MKVQHMHCGVIIRIGLVEYHLLLTRTHYRALRQNPNDDKTTLVTPVGYDPDIQRFISFLDAGKAKFLGK